MLDCIFCKIVKGQIPSKKVYEDEYVYAFYDIAPHAPIHLLIIPKEHIPSADAVTAENSALIARVFEAIPKTAKLAGITSGYRIISNCGADACQSVPHIHFHILGGKPMNDKLV